MLVIDTAYQSVVVLLVSEHAGWVRRGRPYDRSGDGDDSAMTAHLTCAYAPRVAVNILDLASRGGRPP